MVSVAYLMIKQSQEYKQNKGVFFTIKTTLNNFYETHRAAINRFIDQALEEDIEGADHTSNACFDDYLKGGYFESQRQLCYCRYHLG